jgi:hypothetical protein
MTAVALWTFCGFVWLNAARGDWFTSGLQFFLDVVLAGGSFSMANFYLRKYRGLV